MRSTRSLLGDKWALVRSLGARSLAGAVVERASEQANVTREKGATNRYKWILWAARSSRETSSKYFSILSLAHLSSSSSSCSLFKAKELRRSQSEQEKREQQVKGRANLRNLWLAQWERRSANAFGASSQDASLISPARPTCLGNVARNSLST